MNTLNKILKGERFIPTLCGHLGFQYFIETSSIGQSVMILINPYTNPNARSTRFWVLKEETQGNILALSDSFLGKGSTRYYNVDQDLKLINA